MTIFWKLAWSLWCERDLNGCAAFKKFLQQQIEILISDFVPAECGWWWWWWRISNKIDKSCSYGYHVFNADVFRIPIADVYPLSDADVYRLSDAWCNQVEYALFGEYVWTRYKYWLLQGEGAPCTPCTHPLIQI